jgi:hypothetical protein
MAHWLSRWTQRQHDLEKGVDADLVRASNRTLGFAFCLLAAAGLLQALRLVTMPSWFAKTSNAISICLLLVGAVLVRVASAQRWYLNKPDPEPRQSLFKP